MKPDEKGLNYDEGATMLYNLIEEREWKAVVVRATKTPLEAATWIYRREKDGERLRWKQLPLHAAIVFGANEVVVHALLRSFPEAAEMTDDQGMLPVHLAFRHNANEEIIDMLLKIYPEGANLRDRKGRVPITLVRVSDDGESSSLRSYMANFIFERSNVVVSEEKERKIIEMTEAYSEEIQTLQEDRVKEGQKDWERLIALEEKLLHANKLFERWAQDENPDKIDFHTKDYLSKNELHDSLIYSVERFAVKAEEMEAEKEKGIEEGLAEVKAKMSQMEKDHQAELDSLHSLLEGKGVDNLELSEAAQEQKDKLAILKDQLLDRMSEFEQTQQKLEEAKKEGASFSAQVVDLSTDVLKLEMKAQEEKMALETKYSELQDSFDQLKKSVEVKDAEIETLKGVSAENETLRLKVQELLGTMCDVRRETRKENVLSKDETEKIREELDLTKAALSQATETVQTLEDQMAKLYVEKEGLRSRFYSLQQTTTEANEENEESITRLESELTDAKSVMELQSQKITELTNKFDGLTAIHEKAMEISQGKETLLTAKVDHLTTKYSTFQQEIDDYNDRAQQQSDDLEHQKQIAANLREDLALERVRLEEAEEKIREGQEAEEFLSVRVQDLAANLAKVSMERKRIFDTAETEKTKIREEAELTQAESMKRVNELQRIMDDTQASLESLNKRCKELESENESLRSSLGEMAKKLVRSSLEQRTGKSSLTMEKDLDVENETLQKSLSAMKSEIENITSSISTL